MMTMSLKNRCLYDSIICKINCFLIFCFIEFTGRNEGGNFLKPNIRKKMCNKIFMTKIPPNKSTEWEMPQKGLPKIINFNVEQFIIIEFHIAAMVFSALQAEFHYASTKKFQLLSL